MSDRAASELLRDTADWSEQVCDAICAVVEAAEQVAWDGDLFLGDHEKVNALAKNVYALRESLGDVSSE